MLEEELDGCHAVSVDGHHHAGRERRHVEVSRALEELGQEGGVTLPRTYTQVEGVGLERRLVQHSLQIASTNPVVHLSRYLQEYDYPNPC